MPIRSAWLLNRSDDGSGQSRSDTRLAPLGTMTPTGQLSSRSGVVPGSPDGSSVLSGLSVSGLSAGMTATVSAGRAVVQSREAAGAYPVAVTEHTPLVLADGDPDNPRVDLVVLRVYDGSQDMSGRTEAALEVVQGDPGSTPVVPATPTASLPLASVRVPAGASAGSGGIDWASAVSDLRRATVAVGGILPEGWSRDLPGAYPGQYRDTGESGLERWDGTAWRPYPAPPKWRSWTPAWTTSTGVGAPSYGNATVQCRYVQLGTLVHASFHIVFGSTTKFGSGGTNDNWQFTLPVPAAGASHAVGFVGLQKSVRDRVIGRVRLTGAATLGLEVASGDTNGSTLANAGLADSVTPWVWGAGMQISGAFVYEAAEAAR